MFTNLKRNWWPILVVAQAVLGLIAVAFTAIVAPGQQGAGATVFMTVAITIGLISSALLLGGLFVLERNRPVGTWLIVAGSIPTLLTLLALNPVALLAVSTIAGGLWTGNLTFTTTPAEIDTSHPEGRQTPTGGTSWYWWVISAVLLFGVGFAALYVGDAANSETVEGLAWFTWILSWATAAATAAIGVALGLANLITRHRTRPA